MGLQASQPATGRGAIVINPFNRATEALLCVAVVSLFVACMQSHMLCVDVT